MIDALVKPKPDLYTQDLQTACEAAGCRKWAVVAVYNKLGSLKGRFCREDARRYIARYERQKQQHAGGQGEP